MLYIQSRQVLYWRTNVCTLKSNKTRPYCFIKRTYWCASSYRYNIQHKSQVNTFPQQMKSNPSAETTGWTIVHNFSRKSNKNIYSPHRAYDIVDVAEFTFKWFSPCTDHERELYFRWSQFRLCVNHGKF